MARTSVLQEHLTRTLLDTLFSPYRSNFSNGHHGYSSRKLIVRDFSIEHSSTIGSQRRTATAAAYSQPHLLDMQYQLARSTDTLCIYNGFPSPAAILDYPNPGSLLCSLDKKSVTTDSDRRYHIPLLPSSTASTYPLSQSRKTDESAFPPYYPFAARIRSIRR